jgi:hypothetical protein
MTVRKGECDDWLIELVADPNVSEACFYNFKGFELVSHFNLRWPLRRKRQSLSAVEVTTLSAGQSCHSSKGSGHRHRDQPGFCSSLHAGPLVGRAPTRLRRADPRRPRLCRRRLWDPHGCLCRNGFSPAAIRRLLSAASMGLRCLSVRVSDRTVRHLISTGYPSLESSKVKAAVAIALEAWIGDNFT